MTLTRQPSATRPAPRPAAIRASGGARVALVAAGERPVDQLAARVSALPGIGAVAVGVAPAGGTAELAIVRLGPTECTHSLDQIVAWAAVAPVLAIGPVALSSRALRLGATGYLAPRDLDADLEAAVAAVLARRRHLGASVVDGYLVDGLAVAGRISKLSARELEVVCRAGRGESPATTATGIGVAAEAVTQYRLRARAKLGLRTTSDLRVFASSHGLR